MVFCQIAYTSTDVFVKGSVFHLGVHTEKFIVLCCSFPLDPKVLLKLLRIPEKVRPKSGRELNRRSSGCFKPRRTAGQTVKRRWTYPSGLGHDSGNFYVVTRYLIG